MSFSEEKLSHQSNCIPTPETYNEIQSIGNTCNEFQKDGHLKIINSKSTEILNTSPKYKCSRTLSLPVFQAPSFKRTIKLVTSSQSLVVENDNSGNIFSLLASTEDNNITFKRPMEFAKRTLPKSQEEKLNIPSEGVIELFNKISDLKDNLKLCEASEKKLKKVLEEKENYIQDIKKNQTLVRDNINDLTEKMKIERKEKQNYTDCLLSVIKDLKIRLNNALIEKDDFKTIVDGMKSALVIINDKYVALEKELNEIKKEKDAKIQEIYQFKLKMDNACTKCVTPKGTTCDCIWKFDVESSNLEVMVNEIRDFFKSMEDEFYCLKTQFQNEFETTVNQIYNDCNCEMKNMEEHILNGFSQVNTFYIHINTAVTEYLGGIVDQYSTMYNLLSESEIEKVDLQTKVLDYKTSLNEIKIENKELKYNLNETRIQNRNYEIASKDLLSTITALKERLIESGNQVNKLISYKKSKQTSLLKNLPTTDCVISNVIENDKSNECLLELKNIASAQQSKISDDDPLNAHNLLLQLSCVQMKNNSLELQLEETIENLSKLELQKAERDVKLSECKTKISEQADILEQQSSTIDSLHVMLNNQHKDLVLSHELQTKLRDENTITSLEEKLEESKLEISFLKKMCDEHLERYNILLKISSRHDDKMKYFSNTQRNGGEFVYVDQNVNKIESCSNIKKERNYPLESCTSIYNIKQCAQENENLPTNTSKKSLNEKENDQPKQIKKDISSKTRNCTSNKFLNKNANSSPILKDWNK